MHSLLTSTLHKSKTLESLTWTRCQFHQHIYEQIFRTKIVSAAFSCFVLALSKNSYEKCARKTVMKLTLGYIPITIGSTQICIWLSNWLLMFFIPYIIMASSLTLTILFNFFSLVTKNRVCLEATLKQFWFVRIYRQPMETTNKGAIQIVCHTFKASKTLWFLINREVKSYLLVWKTVKNMSHHVNYGSISWLFRANWMRTFFAKVFGKLKTNLAKSVPIYASNLEFS